MNIKREIYNDKGLTERGTTTINFSLNQIGNNCPL